MNVLLQLYIEENMQRKNFDRDPSLPFIMQEHMSLLKGSCTPILPNPELQEDMYVD